MKIILILFNDSSFHWANVLTLYGGNGKVERSCNFGLQPNFVGYCPGHMYHLISKELFCQASLESLQAKDFIWDTKIAQTHKNDFLLTNSLWQW